MNTTTMDTPAATTSTPTPAEEIMAAAFLARDRSFDGVFWAGVRTTGIFCRPGCPARTPRREHLTFFDSPRDALEAGYRPCRRCRPLEPAGQTPDWLRPLLAAMDEDPARRWTDEELGRLGLAPERVRRWFGRAWGMTFQTWARARRLGSALERVRSGEAVARAAFDAGYDSLSGFQEAFRSWFGAPPSRLDDVVIVRMDRVPSRLGPMLAAVSQGTLHLLEFTDRTRLERQLARLRGRMPAVLVPGADPLIERARDQVTEYLEGARTSFDLPHAGVGTPFQREVWVRLEEIPYGETRSYAEVARAVGRPGAIRAVGAANGANPLAVIVPCHRVVASDGSLSGYAGGVWRKRRLLDLEREGRPLT